MKSRLWMIGVGVCLALGAAATGFAAPYYVDDDSDAGDVYTPSATGSDFQNGLTPSTPKRTLNGLLAAVALLPGDVVYIDTGTYAPATIGTTVAGAPGTNIVFQGTTNGTVFTGSGNLLDVRGKHLQFRDLRAVGGYRGFNVAGAAFCRFDQIQAISNSYTSFELTGAANSNEFRRCVFMSTTVEPFAAFSPAKGNYIENCIAVSPAGRAAFAAGSEAVSNMVGCIALGDMAIGPTNYVPARGSRNMFFTTNAIYFGTETMADFQRMFPNWVGNTYADPKFVNAGGFDFHLLSASGHATNGGGGVTNLALEYSPAIDFGPSAASVGDEPAPNGGRVNIGLYGGTAEASKSRTNAWLFAMSFNDGGTLMQTGQLEWVASTNFGATTKVDLQYSTNRGTNWSDIARVDATNETYAWIPAFSNPAVLWRVVATNGAVASTNAKPFSIRNATTTPFTFYVNDDSPANDVYCGGALGDDANSGIASNVPKRSLQALFDAYQLQGGDTVYVDTGTYPTNVVISHFDSGSAGNPVRLIGSTHTNGSVLISGNASLDTLTLNSLNYVINKPASFMEIENLQLSGGYNGFYATRAANVVLRNVRFIGNQWGAGLATATLMAFEGCLSANNAVGAFSAPLGNVSNYWSNGTMWGNPTVLLAMTNSLSVSNSILGGNATTLFGNQVAAGDYNAVWDVAELGGGYGAGTKLSVLQNAGFWTRSLKADPLFADAAGGDYHLKSAMGRYNPATGFFITNALEGHSPAIDLGGTPLSPTRTNEPAPNGARLNAGMFGGTAQASKSRTNAWLQLLSYMDGGTLDAQSATWLRWNGGNYAPGAMVTVKLSRDNGESWEVLATNVAATLGAYQYQELVPDNSSSFLGLLKVELEGAAVESHSPTNFTYRNGTFSFYLNDESTNGAVYCTAPGDDAKTGLSAESPMRNLRALLSKYSPMNPGDRIYVDTGVYTDTNAVNLTQNHSGTPAQPILIMGSTNRVAGGSVFSGGVLRFDFRTGASNIVMRDLVLTNMARGVAMTNAVNVLLDGVEVRGASSRAFDIQGVNARSNQLLRCVAHGGSVGVYLKQATNVTIRNSIFYQNTDAGIYLESGAGLLLENSLLASTRTNAVLVSFASTNGFSPDYNGLHAGPFTRVGVNRTTGGVADNLAAWQTLSGGRDLHSVPGDPQLADPGQYDYHLKTEKTLGRLLPNGDRIADTVSSPLLDAGNPLSNASAEPAPNGGRINIGRHGGTAEASIALDSPWLKTVSFGDAGGVTTGAVPLVWTAGGGFSNQTVAVEVSVDGGITWEGVTSGIPATNGMATWMASDLLPDTPAGTWRVVCPAPSLTAQSSNFFSIRKQPLNLFVATADTNEVVYVTGPGAADNWMATSNEPINSLRTVFERFDLEPGDRLWVDSGTYAETDAISIGMKNSGSATNPVWITGNMLSPYRGTVLARVARTVGSSVFQISRAGGVRMEALMVSNGWTGVQAENSDKITLERVRVGHCGTNAVFAGAGAVVDLNRVILDNNLGSGLQSLTGSVVRVLHSLFRNNVRANVFFRGGNVGVTNSILEAAGSSRFVYYMGGSGTLAADFNNVRATEGANVAGGDNRTADRFLRDWQVSSGGARDLRSSGYDPQFANAAAMDFHLKSAYGRYDPVAGAFTNDAVTNRLIDLGDPAAAYANEPTNNGGRVNVGLYGNTGEASKSSGLGTLVPLTMSDGGTIRQTIDLYWSWEGVPGIPPGERLTIQFSGDGGLTWTNIASAFAGDSKVSWDSTNVTSTAMGVWRVTTTNEPPIYGQTETLFAVKNEPLKYYVNDDSQDGDVYCSEIGSSANSGLATNVPIDSVSRLFGLYKLEPGDIVYVDTGIYRQSAPLVISVSAPGATNRLVIQGSTNEAFGGSVFTNASGAVIELQDTHVLELRDLRLHGGDQGLLLTQSSSNLAFHVRSVGSRGNAFQLGNRSDQNQFIQCAALNFSKTGFFMVAPASVQIAPATNYWIGGVISPVPATSNGTAVSTGALMGAQSGRIYVSNSVFVAASPAHHIYSVAPAVIRGNYNCYHQPFTNSLFAQIRGEAPVFGLSAVQLADLGAWAVTNLSDGDSFAADPLFGDLEGGDLHPKSAGGRYRPATGTFEPDGETSPLIDAADPASIYANEALPNGGRANLGIYGNDSRASLTPTNSASYVLLTLNEGGTARGTQTLKWLPQGEATSTVGNIIIQLSTNSGLTFPTTLATVPASQRQYEWNSTLQPSVPTARWKVQHSIYPEWVSASDRDFLIHNTNLTYFVDDDSTIDNVYCSVPGAPDNTGFSSNSPLPSLADVLSRYDLEPGDVVKIDTGTYAPPAPIGIGYLDCGTALEPVTIQGSTNDSGSVLSGNGLRIENARGVALKNLKFTASSATTPAVVVGEAEDIALDHVDVLGPFGHGVAVSYSSNVFLRNFSVSGAVSNGVASQASFNTRLAFGTIWSNGLAQVSIRNQADSGSFNSAREASFVTVSNCVLGAFGTRNPAYEVRGTLHADHNNLYLEGGALAALSYESGFAREFDSVGSWSSATNKDTRSLSHAPRFADAVSGDFHLKSSRGRYDPATGEFVEVDSASENSPLIDAGDPDAIDLVTNEPPPNGGRVNIGRYGGTSQASKTPTNGALTLISFNDGGRASGTNTLVTWLARGSATGSTVTISYSADGGSTWTVLTNGISAALGSWSWNTTNSQESVEGKLKIAEEIPGGTNAISDKLFSVRNGSFSFYINDGFQPNDVYCGQIGNDAYSGLSSNAPMASLNELLRKYDLEGGDIVYIDTGVYKGTDPWRITQADSAGDLDSPPVVFQGSTHSLLNGTVLDREFSPVGIQVDYAVGVQLRNITVSNTRAGSAVAFNECYNAGAENVVVGNGNIGFYINQGSQIRVANCLVFDSFQGVLSAAGLFDPGIVYPVIENNVFWEAAGAAIELSGGQVATVRNNILSVGAGHYVYDLGGSAGLNADHNAIWLGSGGRVFRQAQSPAVSPVPIIHETVGSWAAAYGQDLHSYEGDPLLANPAGRDFHLKSQAGRHIGGLVWTNDTVSSPLIDAGWTNSTAWINEPTNNGGRINIGLYGGTPWASKTGTNSALHLLTLNRGGVASGLVALNWKASGMSTGHTVRLAVSLDDGLTWTSIATNLQASLGGILWNSSGSSPLARWRVQDEQETNVLAFSQLKFVLHNGSIQYYVNDESRSNDVYCGAEGSSTNTGVSTNSPKRWISEVLSTYDLERGDVIYVDTGVYQTAEPTVIGDLDAGDISQDPGRQVSIRGSTNALAGGSRFIISDPTVSAFALQSTYGIRFDQLQIQSALNGLSIQDSYFVAAEGMAIRGCENGASILASSNIVFSRATLTGNRNAGIYFYGANKGAMNVGSSVMWSNRFGIYLEQGYVRASNSIFGMLLPDSFGFYVRVDKASTGLEGDYNSLYVQHASGAVGGWQTGENVSARTSVFATVSSWALATGQDTHSLAHPPQLADPGSGDFHLKSRAGRYQPGATGLVYDTVSSPLIDSGNPQATSWTAEPDPNGRRLNIGLYGGTAEASRSPTNGWLNWIYPNDGGAVAGTAVELRWSAGGAATNYTIRIDYSPNEGVTWTNVAYGVQASDRRYLWDSVPYGRSALALIRATCEQDESISAQCQFSFVVRNFGEIPYFVNDAYTPDDVFCTAAGDDSNNGLSPAKPKASLKAILDTYELAPEDVVYVDAGTYSAGAPPIEINQRDSGYSNLYVTIRGSTNPVAPTVFASPSFDALSAFYLNYAVNVRLKDLTIRGAKVGVESYQTIGCELDAVRVENNKIAGVNLSKSQDFRLLRSVLLGNGFGGVDGVAVSLSESSLAIVNSVLWNSPSSIAGRGGLAVTNSVLDANGPDGRIYRFSIGGLGDFRGDYNCYSRKDGALIAEESKLVGGNDFYNDLPLWSAAALSDQHSMTLPAASVSNAFANASGGDFHPRSTHGRYANGAWTNDAVLSPLIDAGDPEFPFDQELPPNGGIINIGAYGNTPQASMTQTNPPWVRAISLNEGGVVSSNVLLYWSSGGLSNGTPVRLQFSTNYFETWQPIASNLLASSRQYEWNVSNMPLSLAVYWRVQSQSNTNATDACDLPFSVKTRNYDYYVNDGSTNGDSWCTQVGQEWNPGTNRAQPISSVNALLTRYPVGGGDRIYIDTGEYPMTAGTRILLNSANTGIQGKPLLIYGSTNARWSGTNVLWNGALLAGDGAVDGIKIQNSRYIEMYDLRIKGMGNGVSLENVDGVKIRGLELFDNLTNGIMVSGSGSLEVQNCRIWKNGRYGYYSTGQKGSQTLLNNTLWGNQAGAAMNGLGRLNVSNSILVVTNAAPIYTESGSGEIGGDYNLFGRLAGGVLASNLRDRVTFSNLRQWQTQGRDLHSLVEDPLFVDPAAGNFHLQSRQGYRSNGSWAVSTDTSWAIDAGDPAAPYADEIPPDHGSRINLGAYGGTPEASRSDTNSPALLAVTLRDGGVAPNGQPLYWLYRGIDSTNTVRIEYYDGTTWLLVAGGIPINAGQYDWYSYATSPEALWRVVLESNPAIQGETAVPFTLRPWPLTYFVNDDSRTNDVYTGAFGSPTNRGYVSNSPLHSIQAVLGKYQLLGGDEIKVDTGVYTLSEPVQITLLSRGDPGNTVKFTGSTNMQAGGSRLEPGSGMDQPAFVFYNTSDVDLSGFHVLGFENGVSFQGESSTRCRLMDLDIHGSAGAGIALSRANDIELRRVLIREGETNAIVADNSTFGLDGCVLWSNQYSTVSFGQTVTMQMTNSVLEASGVGNYCYLSSTSTTIQADYNDLFIRNGAQIASIDGLQYEKLPPWNAGATQDVHSLSTDPLFHDPANGDFHVTSKGGRYDPLAGVHVTTDTNYSPLIDMGSPRTAWSNEPATNGNRRNIGRYGNTPQASKSNTNRWLRAVTAMGGGIMYGGVNLVWGYGGGIASNEVVQLWYSYDNGTANWRLIGESAAGAGQLWWQSDVLGLENGVWTFDFKTSPAGRWRVVLKNSSPVVMDMIPTYFGLRNSPFTYYLNDTSRVNDVYTDNIGDNTNMGFYAAAPKLTLKALLDEVDLEPTDRVFVDTGVYWMSEPNLPWMTDTNTPIRWEASDGGEPPDGEGNSQAVVFQGSTHPDGTHFVTTNRFVAGAFFFMEASHVDMRDLWFAGETMQFTGGGLVVSNLFLSNGSMRVASDQSVFENIQVDRGSFTLSGQDNRVKLMRHRWGETSIVGTNVTMMNSVVYTTNQMRTGVVVSAESAVISNCTVVSASGTAISKRGSGTLRLGHNILVAGGPDPSSVIAWEDGGLISDWNNLWAQGASTWVGSRLGRWEKLAYWQRASGQDANSVSFFPMFQNPGEGDFHLNSRGGRWSLFWNDWDYTDTAHSPLIDLGDPGIPAGEPSPSGDRRNLGAYGGTDQASKSLTNYWLTALTQNDGGVLKGTNVTLRWRAGNAGGKYVTLSYFDGTAWTDIATGVLATDESFVWDTTGFPDSFNARWRVVAEDGSPAADTNNLAFPLRNNATDFYVNDANGADDIYCSATGSAANTGLATNSPRLTLQSILDDYDLEGGDRVYVDTGVYPAPSNIRIIWSRSGETNDDVVIQGNTNHAYGTRLTRSGPTGYPAVGLDVKASQIQLAHMAIQGVDRGILLESNRNVTVRNVVLRDSATAGIAVEGAQNTQIRNSGFWNGGWGVSLNNASTSTLENLTFVDFGLAGIRLVDTRADAMQNNIFVPATNAYAYSVGAATSLLMNATMDYNLYDFNRTGSGFYEGWTNIFRKWQLNMDRDFRSALTNARLADIDGNNDFQFHPLSTNGRWTAGGWTMADTNTSWAVDHGNPLQDYSQEPTNHGDRLNIGMYGNTVQASKGNTVTNYEIRTLNDGENIFQDDSTWPMIWSTHLVDSNEWVQVMFSSDGGSNWIILATLPAYEEYFVFSAESQYQTVKGRWQIIGVDDPSLWADNAANFTIRWGLLRILTSPRPVSGLMRFDWAGGVGGLRYRIEYSDDYGKTWNAWEPKYNGPAPINLNNFTIQAGQASPSYTFEDRTSYLRRSRWYRIWELAE